MLKRTANLYADSFKGLSKEIWWLALVTFINRAGTMILPFMSKYLKEDLEFTYVQVAVIMSFFGVGSTIGSWIGGKMTDKIGFYKVMIYSMLLTGFLFFGLQYVKTFWGLCFSILFIMSIADMFRPAMFVSLNTYSKPENRTRSLTLIRLAINLGFTVGPFIAGIIIVSHGYDLLFWIDGITCILSILLFTYLVKEKKSKPKEKKEEVDLLDASATVFRDKPYWIFLGISFSMGIIFFPLFHTMPIYHFEHYGLTAVYTGLLFLLNGFLIFLLEMPMVHWIEKKKIPPTKLIVYASILMATSIFLLLIDTWSGILIVSMLFITVGEMVGFPYTNAFAMKRAKIGNEGRYMGLYSMSFSIAHIFSPYMLIVVGILGYPITFLVLGIFGILAVVLSIWLRKTIVKEESN
ncbi:MFS transporter [Urechidicola croceus]|uniref:MFS transporter n=1 Tax=Urechidicola croceus TaxID=1850246 RepID=A0A1D8P752_9FLAO|nr:MFS transporter [Urechidicola croceus]AOW20395.1 MFS transporter [Urechidicola croceus]